MTTKKISVIIPTYNRAAILRRCLQALVEQTLPRDLFEVVVCDDGSSDDTQAVLQSFQDRLSLQCLRQDNQGPAVARNRAMAVASAPLFLIINDDSILAKDALERHLMASGHKLIIQGSFRTPSDYKQDFFTALVDSTTYIFPFVRMPQAKICGFDLLLTCNTSIPAAAIRAVGGFDESFPSPAGEDIEIGYRLFQAGYSIFYDPAIECFHDSYFTPRGFARLRHMRGLEDMRFLNKHPAMIGRYQETCMAIARRYYARYKQNPAIVSQQVEQQVAALEQIVADYTASVGRNGGPHYQLMEQAYRLLSQVGFMAFVDGLLQSEHNDAIIGPNAINLNRAKVEKSGSSYDLLLPLLAKAA